MERMLRIYPAYFNVTNPEFEHAIFGVNMSDRDITLTYNSGSYLVKPGQIFETDDPVANILIPQGYTYEFLEIKNASGRSTTGEKVNEQWAIAFFPTYEAAKEAYEAAHKVKAPEREPVAKYTAESIARFGETSLRSAITKVGLDQPPEGTSLSDLRAYILAEQGA